MPKMKTKSSAAKRYKTTANGKIKIKRTKLRHILTKKSPGVKRKLRKGGYVHKANMKQAKKCIPYGSN